MPWNADYSVRREKATTAAGELQEDKGTKARACAEYGTRRKRGEESAAAKERKWRASSKSAFARVVGETGRAKRIITVTKVPWWTNLNYLCDHINLCAPC